MIQMALTTLIIIATNFIFLPSNYNYLLPFHDLENIWLQSLGFGLSMIRLLFGFSPQLQMKDS